MGDLGKCKIIINKLQQTFPYMGMLYDGKSISKYLKHLGFNIWKNVKLQIQTYYSLFGF
jgi:hypothetical protein